MTLERALDWFKRRKEMRLDDVCQQAEDVAIECIERQMPQKPKEYEDKFYSCPNCMATLMYKWEQYPTVLNNPTGLNYCVSCGQHIDWNFERD